MSEPDNGGIDWSGVEPGMARQIKTQGDLFLQAQLQAGIASDQRATTTAGICVTLATASVAGGIAYWDKSGSVSILLGAFATAICLLIAVAFAAWSARPVEFFFPGSQPSNWYEIRKGKLTTALGGEAENIDAQIASNDTILQANHRALYRAFWFALSSPIAGTVVWGIAQAISSCGPD